MFKVCSLFPSHSLRMRIGAAQNHLFRRLHLLIVRRTVALEDLAGRFRIYAKAPVESRIMVTGDATFPGLAKKAAQTRTSTSRPPNCPAITPLSRVNWKEKKDCKRS
ncbi:hypothetical protein CCHR01_18283 [Colletotrichum chrysophilum]|uniref:Uncharacterized protein n=1 Tax=Colletotrichum chrysophilum TaxID=1836956 RepID=A0AAD9E8B4_9PEZI|nr:hypothetical protein CCHR01_18283 [Colletotrichum chrysophilum]